MAVASRRPDGVRCPHCGGDLNSLMEALKERAHVDLSRKIKAGVARARAQGKSWGVSPKLAEKQRTALFAAVDGHPDMPLSEIAQKFGISRVTLWRYMREAGYGA